MLAALSLLVIGGTDGFRSTVDIHVRSSNGSRDRVPVMADMVSAVEGLDALRWVSSTAVGRRVEAVAGASGTEHELAQWQDDLYLRTDIQAIICSWACFRQGYRDFNGNPEWEERFIDVLLCEGDYWVGYSGPPVSRYISRAQFDPGSWATATAATELSDPDNPYHVGANMAWWSGAISHPGDSSGWPGCWRRGAGL